MATNKTSLFVRLDDELHFDLAVMAGYQHRSINQLLVHYAEIGIMADKTRYPELWENPDIWIEKHRKRER
jgi:hypothetical protein